MFKEVTKSKGGYSQEDFANMMIGLPEVDIVGNIHEFKPFHKEQSMVELFDFENSDPSIMRFEK